MLHSKYQYYSMNRRCSQKVYNPITYAVIIIVTYVHTKQNIYEICINDIVNKYFM